MLRKMRNKVLCSFFFIHKTKVKIKEAFRPLLPTKTT